MTRIYLIRHAEAEGNLYRIAHGQYDSLITPRGYRQIAALEKRFFDVPVDAVYSSDLFRTKTTAAAIYRPKGLALHTRRDLREILMGTWEDVRWVDLARNHNEMLQNFGRRMDVWSAPGAEKPEEVQTRMVAAVRDIAAKHPGGTVAVFSHGMALRILLSYVEGYTLGEFHKTKNGDNTAVSLIEVEGEEIRLVFRDDNSHLLGEEDLTIFGNQVWWKDNSRASEPGYWFRPFEKEKDAALQEAFLQEAESLGLEPSLLAEACNKEDPRALQTVMEEEEAVGFVSFDTARCAGGTGEVKLLYTLPAYRSRGYGIQLIGQAVQLFRPLGAERVELSCPVKNEEALRFFLSCGLRETARDEKNAQLTLDIGFGEHTRCPLEIMEDRL